MRKGISSWTLKVDIVLTGLWWFSFVAMIQRNFFVLQSSWKIFATLSILIWVVLKNVPSFTDGEAPFSKL
jgi:hypothetical protein